MHEVFSEAFAFVNLPFTVLLGLVAIYWVLVVLGALDTSFGSDIELDGHLEGGSPQLGNHDLSHDGFDGHQTDSHLGDSHHDGFLSGVAHFVNLGDVPLMVIVSVLSLCLWTGSLIANRYFTGHDVLLSLAFLIPNLIVALIATRYLTLPFKPFFRLLRRDEDEIVPVIGKACRITTSQANESFGQAEIVTDGAPLLINVRTLAGASLPKGAAAVVVRADRERDIYFVVEVPRPQLP